ncbi:MAG TPA: ATP-binding protein, partial [Anaerolineales bacterium]|nr:ATP-binding protein [Anaerolineales bacterium]
LSFLHESARALAASLQQVDVLNSTLSFAPRIGAQHAFVLLMDDPTPGHHSLRSTLPGLEGLSDDKARAFTKLLTSQRLVHRVLESQQAAVVRDSLDDPRWMPGPGTEPARSILVAPLRSQTGFVAGVLAYTHSMPGAFSEDQMPLIDSISAQVSVAINNARLYQQVETQRFGAAALAQATQIMVRSLSEAELFQSLTDQLFDIFKPEGVVAYHWDWEAASLIPIAVHIDPNDPDPWPAPEEAFPADDRPDLLDVIRSHQGRIAKLRDEPDGQMRQSMSRPFIFNERAEGAVEIVHTGPASGLTQDDMNLLESMLTSAAFALQTVRLYQQVLDTAERLREVDRLKSQFLANMSHELRTPLNSIIGFSRVIMKGIDGAVTDLQLQDLSAIHNSGQHLLGLINDILDLSRIEAGKMEMNLDRVDMTEIIKGVMSTTVGLVKDKAIRLAPDVQPNLPAVYADSIRVRQVLLNLMANAAKFTEEGVISVRARVVEKDGQRPMVEVSVRDTGMGIPERDLPKLFQTFSQVDGSATRKVGGSGLGLSISRNLIELHGGSIWVESRVGAGSTFTFSVPVYIEKPVTPVELPVQGAGVAAAGVAAAPANSGFGSPNGNGHHLRAILAIDDDARLIDLYRRYLEPKGVTLHGLINPKEAVAAARALRPQLILLDVMMPEHDGWQVLKDLKGHSDTRDIPVIVCSILTEQDKARKLGAVDYLVKPILDVDLIDALNRLEGESSFVAFHA